jgi:hypothetical protein
MMPGSQAIGSDLKGRARIFSGWRPVGAVVRRVRAFFGVGQPREAIEVRITEPSWGWIPVLCLNSALALVLITFSLSAGGDAGSPKSALFCAGTFALFFPLAARIVWPHVSRFEQIGLLLLATCALFTIKFLGSPLGFKGFDEFLHWGTADDILVRQRLFTPNALLPISPLYPALEIAATAVAKVTGLPLFAAALLLMGVSRVIFICALFLFFETVTASSRLAAIACVIYMGNSSFPLFHVSFSYESLAIVFLILAFLAIACAKQDDAERGGRAAFLAAPFLLVLAATHHITVFITVLLLVLLTAVVFLNRGVPQRRFVPMALAGMTAISAWGWQALMGNPVTEYLLPNLLAGLADLVQLLKTLTPVRKPFVSTDGAVSPLWQRATMLSALALICLGLAMGFFRALRLAGVRIVRTRGRIPVSFAWTDDWLVMLVLLTVAFPVTLAFRLTESAWELGNRLGPYLYFGIAPVVAIAVAGAWLGRSASPWRAATVGAALTVMLTGGLFTAWGGSIELPRHYKVVADALSIEQMGIDTGKWTRAWLGPNNRFVADRINRLLLVAYGRQQVVTTLQDQIDTSRLLLTDKLGPGELHALKTADIDYLLVDMRLTQALPRFGVYFERGEDAQLNAVPPEPQALLKFNGMARVSRPFDNGYIIIYDVAALARYLRDAR